MEDDRWVKEPEGKSKTNNSKLLTIVSIIALVIIAAILFLSRETKAEKLILSKSSLTLNVSENDVLQVTVVPEKVQPELVWESSDENIVIVKDGTVTAQKAGRAVVKVSVKDQWQTYAECECTVIEPDVDMETLDILEEPIVLRPGGHQQLSVSYTPENQNEMILWSSTNEAVARVSPRGRVEAIKVGVAFIIATSERTGVADTASISVEGSKGDGVIAQTDNAPSAQPSSPKPAPTTASKPVPVKSVKPIPATTAKPTPKFTKPAATVTTKKPAPAKVTKPVAKSSGTKSFGYATYKGSWPDDVHGRMEFHTSHVIDSRDPKGRVAEPGDYVVGEWSEGHLVQGVWYGADNKAKGSILIGK